MHSEISFSVYITNILSDGQKIAKRLSSSITKETRKTKELLEEYNTISSQLSTQYVPTSASEAFSTTSDFWHSLSPIAQTSSTVPSNTQRDIVESYLLFRRSNEELQLLKQEMHNVISYWTRRIGCITTQLQHMENVETDSDTFSKGVKCLFTKLLWEAELSYKRAVSSLSPIITNTPALASHPTCSLSNTESNVDVDNDDEDDDSSDEDSGDDYDSDY